MAVTAASEQRYRRLFDRYSREVYAYAWSQARGRGELVALMANTLDTVTRLNQAAQQTRIRSG
jgi:hypothetical protein